MEPLVVVGRQYDSQFAVEKATNRKVKNCIVAEKKQVQTLK